MGDLIAVAGLAVETPAGKLSQYENARLELMGVGIPESKKTAAQRALRRIVLCAPATFRFDRSSPDFERLCRLERRYFDLRAFFFKTTDEKKMPAVAARLVSLDAELSRRQSVADF